MTARGRSLWRHGDFMKLWSAQSISLLGSQVVGLPTGAWVDRMRRRPILITSDIARALILGTIPLAYELGQLRLQLRLWMLYPVAFLAGIFNVSPT